MENESIKIKQERDFGEIFNASFGFLRQESRQLGTALLYFVIPVFLIVSLLVVLMQIEQQKALSGFAGDPANSGNIFSGSYFLYAFLTLLLFAIGFTTLKCTIYGYIKLYAKHGKDGFTLTDVWGQVQKYFFPLLGTSIVVGIIVGFGFMFCFIPGIYLGVSLSVIYMALFFEDEGFGSAFSRSFDLTKQRWWLTLGLIVVAYIIVYAFNLLLSLPLAAAGLKSFFTNMDNMEAIEDFSFSTTYVIINSLVTIITYMLMIIPATIIAFQYFSLVEIKEKPSLEDKINEINEPQ